MTESTKNLKCEILKGSGHKFTETDFRANSRGVCACSVSIHRDTLSSACMFLDCKSAKKLKMVLQFFKKLASETHDWLKSLFSQWLNEPHHTRDYIQFNLLE